MFVIDIAGLRIGIHARYPFTEAFCRGYLTTDDPDFTVSVTEAEICTEQANGDYAAGYCECICLYRHICLLLPRYDAFVFHASVVAVDGRAYAFAAKSGTGKSTHTALWLRQFGRRAQIVNGDKPIFRFTNGRLVAYGTPWRGKEGLGNPIAAPLQAICFLERGEENYIRPAAEFEVTERLFHQMLLPGDADTMERLLALTERMLQAVPFYVLQCNMEARAALTAYAGMQTGRKE